MANPKRKQQSVCLEEFATHMQIRKQSRQHLKLWTNTYTSKQRTACDSAVCCAHVSMTKWTNELCMHLRIFFLCLLTLLDCKLLMRMTLEPE